MVTITGYKQYQNEDGRNFFVLVIQGGVEFIRSKQTHKLYATIRQTTIPSTFDEEVCKSLIGTELQGTIKKVETDPYEYTVKETGEVLNLSHRWEYAESEENVHVQKSTTTYDDFVKASPTTVFSANGIE